MPYQLKSADDGLCPDCGKPLDLLTHREMPDGWPAFSICFPCRSVVEVKGDSGETVAYKGGRRKKFTKTAKAPDEPAKLLRLRDYQRKQREAGS